MKNVSFLVCDFHAPGAFVVFSKPDSTEGGPARGLKAQPNPSSGLIPEKPVVVNKCLFRDRIKEGKTVDPSPFDGKDNRFVLWAEFLDALTDSRLDQG